ncbi:helix-turn-helix domain-containing protein [Micromonospora auratinigra]|uniref:Sugar-specific transcriptional regulator TrmB n=1 Tax=Micromonospora auratinigra TaxID=261654 RepID=A0A1A8Z894_9ACTN|nr:helix-turn-helix domain-containing protein [Micromonospora auratinigra]SBT40170.1 Sugar-specific transcriptional regulator TrmB [Micromonospora auratinigra]
MLGDVLGLDADQVAAYRDLVAAGSATPAGFAALLSIPVERSAALLDRLAARGLAERDPAGTARYRAVPPARLRADLVRRRHQARLAELELAALEDVHRAASFGRGARDVVDVVRGPDGVRDAFHRLQRDAREEVCAFVKGPHLVVEASENTAEETAVARGVRYRLLMERSLLDAGPDWFDEIVRGLAAGRQVRIAETLPLKLIVVDGEQALIPILGDPGVTRAGALLVHPGGLLDAMTALFEAAWAQATPVTTTAAAGPLDDLDVRILSLLLAGLADPAVAELLRTSLRSVQRRVRRLMDLTGVRTRMELGFEAARRGWLDPNQPLAEPRHGG